jgi:hypothetical protein
MPSQFPFQLLLGYQTSFYDGTPKKERPLCRLREAEGEAEHFYRDKNLAHPRVLRDGSIAGHHGQNLVLSGCSDTGTVA